MTYKDALEFIHDTRYRGGKDGIKHMRILSERLGNPHERTPMIHVAGTNGKGSVCAYLQAALRCAGYRVGLFTSPYLQRYNERIRIDGRPIADDVLVRHTRRVAEVVWKLRAEGIYPTEFEIKTALAFTYFAEEQVDIAVMEVGLGGRHDSTNVITPLVSVITTIGLDHTKILGDTLGKIAWEKAGIAKPDVPLVLYPDAPEEVAKVVREACQVAGAPFIQAEDGSLRVLWQSTEGCVFRLDHDGCRDLEITLNIAGEHQANNAATALLALLELRKRQGWPLSDEALLSGLRRARWPGRLEWIAEKPSTLLDGAHNPQGMQTVAAFLQRYAQGRKVVVVTGMIRDKDAQGVIDVLAPHVEKVATITPDSPKSVPAVELARLYTAKGITAEPFVSLAEAYQRAVEWAGEDGLVLVAGSLYLAGEMRTLVRAPQSVLLEETEDEHGLSS